MQFHRLTKSKDSNFWSVCVGSDLRLIVHKTESSLMEAQARPGLFMIDASGGFMKDGRTHMPRSESALLTQRQRTIYS